MTTDYFATSEKPSKISMSELGLTERPTSINAWIAEQIAKHTVPGTHHLMVSDVIEIAQGAALHIIADKAALIDNLSTACHANSVRAGWWTDLDTGEDLHGKRNVGELMMLMVTELAEGFEGIRKNLMSDKIPNFTNEEEELADLLHRVFDHAGSRNLRLGAAFLAKESYNATREDHKPENRRKEGGKRF